MEFQLSFDDGRILKNVMKKKTIADMVVMIIMIIGIPIWLPVITIIAWQEEESAIYHIKEFMKDFNIL